MSTTVPRSHCKMIRLLVPEFVEIHEVNDLTFDTVFKDVDLGLNLHTLFTHPVHVNVEVELRKFLEGIGISYETLSRNTKRVRAQDTSKKVPFEIMPFAPTATSQPPHRSKALHGPRPWAAGKRRPPRNPEQESITAKNRRANNPLESTLKEARARYCNWAAKIGTKGISDMLLSAQEEIDDKDPSKIVSLGSLELSRQEFMGVTTLLIEAGELNNVGVHGYVASGALEALRKNSISKAL